MNGYPKKTLELYLKDGTISGVIEVEMSNWNGKGIKIPRKRFKDYGKDVLNESGLYFLICENRESNEEEIYIGQSGNIYMRNKNRLSNKNSSDYYDWKTMIVFMRENLDSGRRLYAENEIRRKAEECNRYEILTSQTNNEPLKESYRSEMDEFIENVRTILNVLGYKLLEPFVENREEQLIWELETIKDKKENIKAKALYNDETQEMLILKNSLISSSIRDDLNMNVKSLRNKSFENGIIDANYKLTEDVNCNSPSEAFKFVVGYSGGPINWKNNKTGKNLKEYIDELEKNEDK